MWGLRELQWDLPNSGLGFDGAGFGFWDLCFLGSLYFGIFGSWDLSAAPHEQSLRCGLSWPHILGCPRGPTLTLFTFVGSGMCGAAPSQPAGTLAEEGGAANPPRDEQQHHEAFLDPKNGPKLPPSCGHCRNSQGRLLGEEELCWKCGNLGQDFGPGTAGSLAGASPALSQGF